MKLTDAERGMLLSKMGDETVASIFGKSAGWVRRARAALAEEAAKPPEPRNCAKQEKAPRSVREAPDPKPAPARKLLPPMEISPLDHPPWAGTFTVIKAPAPAEIAKFLGEPGQTFIGRAGPLPPAEVEKPATRPAQRRRDRDPRLTSDLLRYVGWFHAAAWTWREISDLFEIEADVLRDALTPADAPA